MFDAAFGVVANFTAGENEATTVDMSVSFLRGVEYGMELYLKVYIVKAGRSLIRQRAELTDAATGQAFSHCQRQLDAPVSRANLVYIK